MGRKILVVVALLVGVGLVTWSGVMSWRARHAQQQAAAARAPQPLPLTPDKTGAPPADADQPQMPPSPLLGKMAPAFKLKTPDGKEVTLASFKGRPVLVNFWATWCGPCKFETPWLVKLRDQYAGQGFEVLGIDTDGLDGDSAKEIAATRDKVIASAKTLKIDYPVLLGGDKIADSYGGIDVLPMSFYVDKTGKVVSVITGAGSEQQAQDAVKKAIGA